ncbi:MAG: DUF4271 domain-containing protein [Prevotellaceae bacterium]|jgi:hypothetical protein|nr:DUF4271 domain-containing protein [Prevotellaceae bacterium]
MPDTLNHVKSIPDTIKVDIAVSTLSPVPESLKADTTKTNSSNSLVRRQIGIADSNIIVPQVRLVRIADLPETDSVAACKEPDVQIFDRICLNPELEIAPLIDHRVRPLKQLRQVAPFEIYGKESISPGAWTGNKLVYKAVDFKNDTSYKSSAVISLIAVFILLTIFSGRHLPDMFRAAYTYRYSGKRYSENYKFDARSGIYFTIFCGLILPFFIFKYLTSCGLFDFDYCSLLLAYPALIGLWLLQAAATRVCAVVARADSLIGEINFSKRLMTGIAGIALFPVVVTLLLYEGTALHEVSLNVGFAILILMIIGTIIRMFVIFLSAKVSAFRFFLYLCAFEISPYLALYIVFK